MARTTARTTAHVQAQRQGQRQRTYNTHTTHIQHPQTYTTHLQHTSHATNTHTQCTYSPVSTTGDQRAAGEENFGPLRVRLALNGSHKGS